MVFLFVTSCLFFFFFFFSSRRRHTRWNCDWSSDVCSSDLAGFAKLTVWLKMDVPDTDLEADLYEILPDGGSVALTGASMRARYRESLREARPVMPGKIEKYVFDNFTFFARRIGKGSRLRLVVRSINSTGSEKNYNSGGIVAAETGKDAKTAHISLVHDKEHPCVLELPVVKS